MTEIARQETVEEQLRASVPELGEHPTVQTILAFAHNVFEHDGWNTPESLDPFTVLEKARAGEKMRCVEYTILASSLLTAFGTPARRIAAIHATDEGFDGHVFIEYWDKQLRKWVMHDPQWGITPYLNTVPLSSQELRQTFEDTTEVDFRTLPHLREGVDPSGYKEWVRPYMDCFDTPGVVPIVDHKSLEQHKSEMRLRLARNAEVASKLQGVGPSHLKEVSAQEFYAPPL